MLRDSFCESESQFILLQREAKNNQESAARSIAATVGRYALVEFKCGKLILGCFNFGMQQRLVHFEIAALEAIGRVQPRISAANFTRPFLPLDEDDVLPRGTAFPARTHELERAVFLDDPHGNLLVRTVGASFTVEVDSGSCGWLASIQHLPVHGIQPVRLPTAGTEEN